MFIFQPGIYTCMYGYYRLSYNELGAKGTAFIADAIRVNASLVKLE